MCVHPLVTSPTTTQMSPTTISATKATTLTRNPEDIHQMYETSLELNLNLLLIFFNFQSLCSSSASSRGSLHHPPENNPTTTHKMLNSVEDISIGSDTTVVKQPPPTSRLARPSGLKQPTAVRSGLPRPTNFTKR